MRELPGDGFALTRRGWLGLAAAGLAWRPSFGDDGPAAKPSRWEGGLRERRVLKQPGRTMALAFSRDGTRLAVAGMEPKGVAPGWVTVWDVGTWARVAKHDLEGIRPDNVSFTPDGARVVVGCCDAARLILVRVDDGRWDTLLENKEHGYRGGPVLFSPDDRVMVSSSPDGLMVWDATAWEWLQTLPGTRDRDWQLAAVPGNPDWKLIGCWFLAMDGDAGRIREPVNPRPAGQPVFRPARNDDPTVFLRWTAGTTAERVDRLRHLTLLAYTPYGPSAAVAGFAEDGSECVTFYEPTRWARGARVTVDKSGGGYVYGLAFSPDGRVLFAGCADRVVRRWRASDGHDLPALKGFDGAVGGLAFSPDGGTLAATDIQGGAVRVWSPE